MFIYIIYVFFYYCITFNTFMKGQGTCSDNAWSPAGGGGRSAIQFTSGVDAIVAGGGGGGGAGNTNEWNPASTGPLGE